MNLAYKKILGKFTKVLGFGKSPPQPSWEKFPNNIVFFESVPNDKDEADAADEIPLTMMMLTNFMKIMRTIQE